MSTSRNVTAQEAVDIYHLIPSAAIYLEMVIQPYRDALAHATSTEMVLTWIPQVLPASCSDVLLSRKEILHPQNLEDQISTVIDHISFILCDYVKQYGPPSPNGHIVTPWSLSSYRTDDLIRIFGNVTTELPISIVSEPNVFNHTLSQDYVFGLATVLNDNQIMIMFNNTKITLGDLIEHYLTCKEGSEMYMITIANSAIIYFNGRDVIQGIATACQWLNINPSTVILDFRVFIDSVWTPHNLVF